MRLGHLLRQERKRCGLTQLDVCELTGVPRCKLSNYERLAQVPCRRNLEKLLELYETAEDKQDEIYAAYETEKVLKPHINDYKIML